MLVALPRGLEDWLPLLLKLLAVAHVQELKLPALQRLEVPAKTALALLKYLPLPAGLAADAAASLQGGRDANLWTARAAALVFAQYFWFRHVFLLPSDTCTALQVRCFSHGLIVNRLLVHCA